MNNPKSVGSDSNLYLKFNNREQESDEMSHRNDSYNFYPPVRMLKTKNVMKSLQYGQSHG